MASSESFMCQRKTAYSHEALAWLVLLGLSYQVPYYALCGESLGTWIVLACSCIQPYFVWGEPGDVASSGTSSVSDIEWVHCDQSWKGLVQLMRNC